MKTAQKNGSLQQPKKVTKRLPKLRGMFICSEVLNRYRTGQLMQEEAECLQFVL